jgi:hypothetical protein
MVLMIEVLEGLEISPLLTVKTPGRSRAVDAILRMCDAVFPIFRRVTAVRGYRYRSDGYQIPHTQVAYARLLNTIRHLILPGDDTGLACLLIPNSLSQPTSLEILAHAGYDEGTAARAKLDLKNGGQGLCGRAYIMREPFFALHASDDMRVAYAHEEHAKAALAIPLLAAWGGMPFAVLYLASRRDDHSLSSDTAYVALILGSILSELLGRWWLTRLRRKHDVLLHAHIGDLIHWFDGMDLHGPDFERGLDVIEQICLKARDELADTTVQRPESSPREQQVTLVVFDIDHLTAREALRCDEPFLLVAQRHVQKAIAQIVPNAIGYWFKNDHTLLVFDACDLEQTLAIVRRIANQVRNLPLTVPGVSTKLTISVSAALKTLTYQDLSDLPHNDRSVLRDNLRAIIDDLYEQTREKTTTIRVFRRNTWETA